MADHDAILLLSFGGPEGPDDVIPFLENVTRGRGVPRERLEEVAEQYRMFGGVSPINDQNRALLAALRAELDRRDVALPLHWGNRNWAPYVEDTMVELAAAGHRRVLALTTSAFSSYSACRQYLEDIERARATVGEDAPVVDKIRPYWNHPGFVGAVTEQVRDAVASAPEGARLVFTAHSIPMSMATTSDYEAQLRTTAAAVVDAVAAGQEWDLVFQSRSGPPQVPWLEPDIVDHLHALADRATEAVVVVPLGFVSDHMEVKFDLDTQAAEAAASLGITMVRASTVGTHPVFVSGLVDLIEQYLGGDVAACSPDCCPAPVRPARR
ncbi:ferrochelatase [Actinospongicola halichondriae]|uniref:ferrochelatase n=1 Tax=Actinospongicola halichondriae TaxID=3236844 RepID=UPI003D534B45